jgi:uncharacterized protein
MTARARPTLVRGAVALATAGAVAVTVVLTGSGPVAAETGDHGYGAPTDPGITVTGIGSAAAAPDVMRVHLATSSTAADVSTAIATANATVKRIRGALTRAGVKPADVSTSDFSVHGGYTKKTVNRFTASHSLSVILRDLERAGQTIADAAAAGGNATRIYSVNYDISDRRPLLEQARQAAYAEARAKAETYAKLAGRTLGTVASVHEGNADYYGGDSALSGLSGGLSAPSAVPLSPGTRSVSVATSVVWNLV